MNISAYSWGHEHFCPPDATKLYYSEHHRLQEIGHPKSMPDNPVPATFCSHCLKWFDDPAKDQLEGSGSRPPERNDTP